jgi:hypothetical protein
MSIISVMFSDWNELFTTKCVSCGFPIEAGDRWVEALNNNYHSQCFNCTVRYILVTFKQTLLVYDVPLSIMMGSHISYAI